MQLAPRPALISNEPFIVEIPTLIKAHADKSGRRWIECEASCAEVDLEGDLIEQKALLDAAPEFVKNGALDIDHISEVGHRYQIANPESYVIGRPLEVKDLGSGRTGVVGEIRRAANGVHNPTLNRFDAFWDAVSSDPPVLYRASIYGFPTEDGFVDCREQACFSGATRYHIKAMQWKSLALTTRPINDKIKGHVRVISAKAFFLELAKSGQLPSAGFTIDPRLADANSGEPGAMPIFQSEGVNGYAAIAAGGAAAPSPLLASPRNMSDALGQFYSHMAKDCAHTGGIKSTIGFCKHFEACCGMPSDLAELYGHALMHRLLLDKRRN